MWVGTQNVFIIINTCLGEGGGGLGVSETLDNKKASKK